MWIGIHLFGLSMRSRNSGGGGIDLDPASSQKANQTIRAKRIYTLQDDGLKHEWRGKVFLNPPYHRAVIGLFLDKLIQEVECENCSQAILLVNNCTETKWGNKALERANAVCFPNRRIRFLRAGVQQGNPLQGQMILYYGNYEALFVSQFRKIGAAATLLRDD